MKIMCRHVATCLLEPNVATSLTMSSLFLIWYELVFKESIEGSNQGNAKEKKHNDDMI